MLPNHVDSQQLGLSNEGSLRTKVNFFLYDPDAAFKFIPTVPKHAALQRYGLVIKDNDETSLQLSYSQIHKSHLQSLTRLKTCKRNSDYYRFKWTLTVVPTVDPNNFANNANTASANAPVTSQTLNPLSESAVLNQNTTGHPSVTFPTFWFNFKFIFLATNYLCNEIKLVSNT